MASRARGWLEYWRDDVGVPGFYPFDLLAAYTIAPERFSCARAQAWIARDLRLWGRLWGPWALLVHPAGVAARDPKAHAPVVYCERPSDRIHDWLIDGLAGDNGG